MQNQIRTHRKAQRVQITCDPTNQRQLVNIFTLSPNLPPMNITPIVTTITITKKKLPFIMTSSQDNIGTTPIQPHYFI